LLDIFLDPGNGGDMFLQCVIWFSTEFAGLHSRGQNSK
jgi:hypothetical protein